jgi:amidophosphoribosyltransferase
MCGIFGVFGARKAAELTVIGLHGIQHRAIDYAGISTTDGKNLYSHRGEGLARQVFADQKTLDRLHGQHALGHIRYPTTEDDPTRENIQPIEGSLGGTPFVLAHNGNLTNTGELHRKLDHCPMKTSMDSEYIVRLIENEYSGNLEKDLKQVFRMLKGSYTLGILFPDCLIAVVDPTSNRPLCLGELDDSYFICSETSGFGGLDVRFVRDINPGEMYVLSTQGGLPWQFGDPEGMEKKCRFEGNYYALPTSKTFGEPVDEYRNRLGQALEVHCPTEGADIVTPVPDSATWIARGYARSGRSGVERQVIVRSHYVGRTFIAATQAKRDSILSQKFHFAPHAIEGKKIVVVDDSIVRGTTAPKIVAKLRHYGAKEVHLRIGSPPILHPCLYGINTPKIEELISAQKSKSKILEESGADSLEFLPLDVQKKLSPNPQSFCFACMDGQYWHT